MRRGARFPGGQAELVFSDVILEQLESINSDEQLEVLAEIVRLCEDPAGKHPLSAPLAGWNTLDVLGARHRVVYKATLHDGVGLLEILCVGPRSDSEVYDMAMALTRTQLLTEEEVTQLWDALGVLDVVTEDVGLDGWDYRPEPAPEGLRKAAVQSGLLDEGTAALLAKDEVEAAMNEGWGDNGPEPARALEAALERARGSADFSARKILEVRSEPRCDVLMARAKSRCIRRTGHPGPHRAS